MGRKEHDNNDLQGVSCSTQKRGKKMTEKKMKPICDLQTGI